MVDLTDLTTDRLPLLRRRPLVAAAIVSVLTVIVALVWLVAGAFTIVITGVVMASLASTAADARRAVTLVSVGFGLAVGPAVYLLLAAVVKIAA